MKHYQKILIIDDEEALRSILVQRLKRKGYDTMQAGTAEEGAACVKDNLIDVVLLDLKLPDGDGLSLLPRIKQMQPDIQVVMLTGHGTIESAIEAMKLGAYDYLTKPCNFSELEITLEKAQEQRKLLIENKGLRQVVSRQTSELKIIAKSPQMSRLLEITGKFAQADAPVLIQGESGVGKELFARAIHLGSARANRSYIPLNAGAIPEALIESELFGHEKGAFTGAGGQKIGLVEMADNGTLFLDEIGEMPLLLQVKLLRFLESGEFRRVGDTRLRRVDVRIVAATNRDLQQEVNQGKFRQDLYYRLNSLILDVPPLRERRDDIIPLAEYFLESRSKVNPAEGSYLLSSAAKEQLLKYNFPGNVRELAHLVQRGMILTNDGIIEPIDIWPEKVKPKINSPQLVSSDQDNPDLSNDNRYPTLADVEKNYILSVLEKTEGNRNQAAKLLDISVRNLYRKIQSYGVE
ncbi:sigma-54-dependent transcriptional regulator [Dehalobacterium formicoaceticum]|uniref:Stage 0 sporulation protein A homolog n=1 Tax=Dehalobacterium formicoaceticum TaxID=51515 RepID=A0ABT1Y6H1_9FIRM|nr:sigma-54 dependent transcriptional regulator [Dehalobacterium formicoaceticum]MCR6546061.1 sigma-54 dependent transcriptional regulator [Dehalobacterium formicoaceticum]